MNLKPIFIKIDFAKRYQELCAKHLNFDERLRGSKLDLYENILNKLGYDFKYFSKEKFYQIYHRINDFSFNLHLVLKDGLVESLLYIKKGDENCIPAGRLDFLPEDMGIPFDRNKYNLPLYTSSDELQSILAEIFSIYEDLKREILNQESSSSLI